jgi:ABC-type sugar transport system ATPase subunit
MVYGCHRAPVKGADLIIFDEPTRSVDVGAIVEIHELIQRLADEGKAVVVISSYLPEIMALSDRFLVSRQGKVVEEFSALEATEEKIGSPGRDLLPLSLRHRLARYVRNNLFYPVRI